MMKILNNEQVKQVNGAGEAAPLQPVCMIVRGYNYLADDGSTFFRAFQIESGGGQLNFPIGNDKIAEYKIVTYIQCSNPEFTVKL
jgi:hypothetical protein